MKLEDWIHETLAKIRARYTAARFLVKIQNQTPEELPDYQALGIDRALYERRQLFIETLPSEFLSQITEIMIACDKNIWKRKSILISAITMARQATVRPT